MTAHLSTDFEKHFEPGGKFAKLSELEKGYMKLDHLMWRRYKEGAYDVCDEIAEQLLGEPELPLMLRARAHIMLSYTIGNDAVAHARLAYDLMNEDVRELCQEGGGRFPQITLDMAERALADALASGSAPQAAETSDDESESESVDSLLLDEPEVDKAVPTPQQKYRPVSSVEAAAIEAELERLNVAGTAPEEADVMDTSEEQHDLLGKEEEPKLSLKSTLKHALSSIVPGGALPVSQHGLVTPAASRQVSSLEELIKTPAASQGDDPKVIVPPTPPGTGQSFLKRLSSRRFKNEFGAIVEKPKEG